MPFFYIIHIVVCVFLVLIILFQEGKAGGLVSVADTGNSVFGARGANSFLTKLTSGIALVFMVTSVFLAFLNAPGSDSIADDYIPPSQTNSATIDTQPPAGNQQSTAGAQVIDADGNTKSLAESVVGTEIITDLSQVPAEILADDKALREKAEADRKKAEAAKKAAEKPKTDQPKKDSENKDQ